jgi:hypothetical protein
MMVKADELRLSSASGVEQAATMAWERIIGHLTVVSYQLSFDSYQLSI